MGLLDKTNPNATRQSVIRHALIFGAMMAVAFPIACIWLPWFREFWPVLLPMFVLAFAGIGALMEWQLNDEPFPTQDMSTAAAAPAEAPGSPLAPDSAPALDSRRP
jgi:hypothetical protein